jgi:hypothetical protein
MNVGMLWLDDNPARDLREKVALAAARYCQHFGEPPDTCFVNQSMIAEAFDVGDVHVAPSPTVLLHHFWIGKEDE